MTSDKARKKAVRARMQLTGEPYAEAARHVGRGDAGAPIARPADIDQVPGAVLPAPVAVMMARHIEAAALHLGTAHRLAADNQAPGYRGFGRDDEPMDLAHHHARSWVRHLAWYAERSAVASGAVAEMPRLLGDASPGAAAAFVELYPGRDDRWCAAEGGTLPLPGQDPAAAPQDDDAHNGGRRRVRYLLPGPVPATRLRAHARGRRVVQARDVVPGTPAAPIWDALGELESYKSAWMNRAGDSPADLAAALDGLRELAEALSDAAAAVVTEIQRRVDAETLTGVDTEALRTARTSLVRADTLLDDDADGTGQDVFAPVRQALDQARSAMDGGRAALPPPRGLRVPDRIARRLAGRAPAAIRDELGAQEFTDRQISKVTSPMGGRADALGRVLAWMHASGTGSYDPDGHAADDPARTEG